jgi:hypothetical protein
VVITEDQAIRLLSEANPVPDGSTLDINWTPPTTRLAEYAGRNKEMSKEESESRRVPRSRPVIVGAVGAVAVLVIVGLFVWQARERSPVADQQTPVETAEAFLDAYYGSFDVDQAFAYLGVEPEAVGLSAAGAANYHLFARFLESTGSQLVDLQCEELGASTEGTVVSCSRWTHDFFSDELGLGPFGPDADELTIVDGKVISIVDRTDEGSNQFSSQIWKPFADWIEENHPEDRAVMYDPFPNGWRITEESIPVWEQRLREYVAEVRAPTAGVIDLPGIAPAEAIPSTPETGELVASMWEHEGAPGHFGNGWLYLYADGRLLWEQLDPADPTGGWLEQRLTPEGVELIRSEIIATGLFEPDQPPPPANDGWPRETNGASVQVRNADQLVYVNRVVLELQERLAKLWSWLPEDAWEDAETKPYVPSRYAVCFLGRSVAPIDPSDHLSALPAAAQNLLSNATQLQVAELAARDPAGMALQGSNDDCYDVTAEEARTLATILNSAEGIEEISYDRPEVFYLLSVTREEYNATITLAIWPMLPHGVPAFTGA